MSDNITIKVYDGTAGAGYTDEQAQDAVGSILTDSSEIDFTYNDATPSITATLKAGSIDETKLDASTNASLDKADSALQPAEVREGETVTFDNSATYVTDAATMSPLTSNITLSGDVADAVPHAVAILMHEAEVEPSIDLGNFTQSEPTIGEYIATTPATLNKILISHLGGGLVQLTYVQPVSVTTEWGDIAGTLSDQTDLQSALDGKAPVPVVVSGNTTAALNGTYNVVATATISDPSPTEGKGYVVYVKNGTATVGGTAYSTVGTVIHRVYHSGSWANTVIVPIVTTQTGSFSWRIPSPTDTSYTIILKAPYAGTITETTTKCASGTATATFKINTTALGGTANSVSSAEQSQAHASSNSFAGGDDIVVTISSNSSCIDLDLTIKYTYTLA